MFGRIQDTDMSMPTEATTQIFNIKNLSTKSVTLYPTRAHISREITNVLLKPGAANEIQIYGLSPTVDEHSIQIEGQGAATIADMTVELVPNRDIFQETYPDESESSDDDSDIDYWDSDEGDVVKEISQTLKTLQQQLMETTEIQNSATERLLILDRYSMSTTAEHLDPDKIFQFNKKYEEERASIFKSHYAATMKLAELEKQIKRQEIKKVQAGKDARKKEEKIAKQKAKDKRQKELQKAEKRRETKYAKQEKLRYWAKKVYKITLLLETTSLDTPGSSRRNSMDSVTLASSPRPGMKSMEDTDVESMPETSVTLSLSYVTKEAGWSPRYDIRISSLQKTATIIYRTEFLNRTSETWKDARLSFSTSQTSYQGLDDVVPFMHAWHIKLSRHVHGDGGLLNPEETRQSRAGRTTFDNFNRAELFGLDDNYIPVWQSKRPLQVQQTAAGGLFSHVKSPQPFVYKPHTTLGNNNTAGGTLFGQSATSRVNANPFGGFGSAVPSGGLFGSQPAAQNSAVSSGSLFGSQPAAQNSAGSGNQHVSVHTDKDTGNNGVNDNKINDEMVDEDPLDFGQTSWEDNGLTATYDVPGVRTLHPSSITRRHKIATLNASNILLSHICVPKLRSAAFLRAKIRNPSSSITLLKGSAGVTLDFSFLGNMSLPRISPGQIFDLPLGVDPAIHVNYPKPSVHRSTQGLIFNKESAQIFTRSVWLSNTKPQPVDILVIDQVPVSEDERLRVVIRMPRGLSKEGDSVKAGQSAKEGSSGAVAVLDTNNRWGSTVAKLKKAGEVDWSVKLEKGQACLLKLEYEARLPPSERIVPA